MSQETVTRRLAAIVSVDVAGYSRLMAIDEVATVRRLTEYRDLISRQVESHGGRVVDNPGDNALLEFPSATSAVECAIAIQEEIGKRNAGTDSPMEVRIGVHLGEVMVEDGRIYGDGVNVAARLEAIAPVGGICVSKTIRDQVQSKIETRFEDMGQHQLKNIREPVHAFRVGPSTLGAVVSAGVANLSSFLAADAEGALSALKAHRTASDPIVLSHGGRVARSDQNRIVYEFPSAMEAVTCSSEVQALMAGRNATVPPERRMQFQLGVHEGSDEAAGVVAARIQELSGAGGICLSQPIFAEVADQLPLTFTEIGDLEDGSKVWSAEVPRPEHAPGETATSGPGALLVLPFERLGTDAGQDYLVDGITEDLTTALASHRGFHVIPRSAAFAYRDDPKSDRQIARELDATYVLRGSVRIAGDRVRVSAQLSEAESERAIWAERFDRDMGDLFELQDELAQSISLQIAPEILKSDMDRSLSQAAGSFESWDLFQRAKWHYYRTTKEDYRKSIQLLEQAISANERNSDAMAFLSFVLSMLIWRGWSSDVAADYARAVRHAERAVEIDPGSWRARASLATSLSFTGQHEKALALAPTALPWYPAALGLATWLAGDVDEAIRYLTDALRMSPGDPDAYHWRVGLSYAHFMGGNYPAALSWAEQAAIGLPDYVQVKAILAASHARLGHEVEARRFIDEFLEQKPEMTAKRFRRSFRYKHHEHIDDLMDALVLAGLPPGDERADEQQRAVWIAVLPFDNIGSDPDQEYFADGVTEDVITGLSAYRSLRVIARTSSSRYRNTELSIPQIAEELGVRYVLEGSVRKAGNRVRVTAQLIEAPDRHHVWADRYDSSLDDIFDAQDRITSSIVAAIDPAIRADHVSRPHPGDLRAWDHVQRGWYEAWKAKPEANRRAIEHFRKAIDIDPDYAEAHAALGNAKALGVWLLWSEDPESDLAQAERYAKRAIELDQRDAWGHEALAVTAYARGRMEATIREADRAIQLNPSRAAAYMMAGAGRIHGGDPDAGIPLMTKAMEISPHDPFNTWFLGGRAIGHLLAGHYEEAVADAREAIKTRYGYLMGRVILTTALVQLGRDDEAKSELATILEIDDGFNPDYLARYTLTDDQRQMFISALKAAGLP